MRAGHNRVRLPHAHSPARSEEPKVFSGCPYTYYTDYAPAWYYVHGIWAGSEIGAGPQSGNRQISSGIQRRIERDDHWF